MTDETKDENAPEAVHEKDLQSRHDEAVELADQRGEDLAKIAAALAEHGLAPEGDYNIAEAAVANIAGYAETRKELEAANKKLKGAATAAKATKGAKPAKARKIAALAEHKYENAAELIELIQSADTVEVAFSNGKTEVAELEPLVIAGDAWTISLDRVKLNMPGNLIVHGPGGGKAAYSVLGYGLLLDGELVAYSPRADTLQIGANAQINLKDDIVF